MKKSARAIAAALLVGFAAMGSAQAEGVYAGLAYTQYNFEGSGSVGAVKPTAATFKLGYVFTKNIAVEGRFAAPATDDSVTVSNIKVSAKVDNHIAIFAKGILPLNDSVSLYGLVGFNDLTLKATGSSGGQSASASSTKNGSSVGVGVDVAVGNAVSLNAEWARHFSDVSSLSFGVNYKF